MPAISPKGWTLDGLLGQGPRFEPVPRCGANDPNLLGRIAAFERDGVPLIIEGWHMLETWPKNMFAVEWLLENGAQETISVRNVVDRTDTQLTLSEFITHSRAVAAQRMNNEAQQGCLYNKDALCPSQWAQWVQSTGSLPEQETVESLMCYLGVDGTFTPCHKDLCASSGQNLMCHTENNGSSFWFMTESQAAFDVAKYFQAEIGKELDWEDHAASVEDFANAPFTTFIAEQRLGDLVLVPPRSSHQVVNSGGLTVKTSWSRMTVAGITTALYHELPLYRRVCRAEQYRVKHILYRALTAMTDEIKQLTPDMGEDKANLLAKQLKELVILFDFVLREEYVHRHGTIRPLSGISEALPNLACDFCAADVFQTFFECPRCHDNHEDLGAGGGLIICSSCYVEGRTCSCGHMQIRQCRFFSKLLEDRNTAAETYNVASRTVLKLPIVDDDALQGPGMIMISEAADILRGRRNDFESETYRESGCRSGHRSPSEQIMQCKVCHAGRCFRHLLIWGVHSAEAILLRGQDQDLWHRCHQHAKADYASGQEALQEADRRGCAVSSFSHKLVSLARNHGSCRPLNFKYTRLGWYDEGDDLSDSFYTSEDEYHTASYISSSRPRPPRRRRSAPVVPTLKSLDRRSPSRGPTFSAPLSVVSGFTHVKGREFSLRLTTISSSTSSTLPVDQVIETALSSSGKRRSMSPTGTLKGALRVPPAKRQRRETNSDSVVSHNAISQIKTSMPSISSDPLSQDGAYVQFVEAYDELKRLYDQQRSLILAQRLTIEGMMSDHKKMRDRQRTLEQEIRNLHAGEELLGKAEQLMKNAQEQLETVRAALSRDQYRMHFARAQHWMNDNVGAFKQELVHLIKDDLVETLYPLAKMVVVGLVNDHLRSLSSSANAPSDHARPPEPGSSTHLPSESHPQWPNRRRGYNDRRPPYNVSRQPPGSNNPSNRPPPYLQDGAHMHAQQPSGAPSNFISEGPTSHQGSGRCYNRPGDGHMGRQHRGSHFSDGGPSDAPRDPARKGWGNDVNTWESRG